MWEKFPSGGGDDDGDDGDDDDGDKIPVELE